MNADYQWMDENYRAQPENGENERDMKDIDFILDEYRIHISFIVENFRSIRCNLFIKFIVLVK